ncbi:MAG TPA: glycosyltransferase [Allosphingosinicella sp.]|jgi:glycosyltransferase involved in cell wall biosynthesis
MRAPPAITIAILAHNEERRIGACLASLAVLPAGTAVHVVVNGSRDRTAELARAAGSCFVHDYKEGGKARSWNRFLFDERTAFSPVHVFVDGDAEVAPGSLEALAAALAAHPHANAASAVPLNGRNAAAYRRDLIAGHGLFGDLYALRGDFLARMRAGAIRLPVDLVGDDSLVGALAKTDLGPESGWDDMRVVPVPEAGFLCEPVSLSPASLALQYRRMVSYSVRHFQNRIVSDLMRRGGPAALPERMADLYAEWLPRFAPRPRHWWFDRLALARMAGSMRAAERARAA